MSQRLSNGSMNQMNDKADMEEQTETKLSKELVFSAIEGDGKSMIKVGDLLWDGEGFEKDEKRALLWYSLAADKGWISDNLLKYYKKEPITIERLEKIEVWLLKGGIGSYEDFVDLIKEHEVDNMNFWLDVAVKYNLLTEFSELINSKYYTLGSTLCEQWLSKAIEIGNAEAMYARAEHAPAKEKVRWYTEAAESGSQSAISLLGFLYKRGKWHGAEVDIDYEKAVYWFEKSTSHFERTLAKDLKEKMEEEK